MRSLRRELTAALEDVVRRPDYRLYAFDVKLDDYTAIIAGTYTQTPLDITDFVSDINWTPTEMRFALVDETGAFHPDTGSQAHYFKNGCILRLLEGDTRVDQAHWVWTFTGALKGQMGWQAAGRGEAMRANVTVFSREANKSYNRRKITSREYTMGTDLGVMVSDIAEQFMGLSAAENLIPRSVGWTFQHRVNQIAQLSPWEALNTILHAVNMVPAFNGEGRLTAWTKNLALAPVKELNDYTRIYALTIPDQVKDYINKIVVVFLDSKLEEVEGMYQRLGMAEITTGFFTFREDLDTYWADDKKQRAKDTVLKTIKSVNDNLLPVGSESYQQVDEFHGRITIEISVWVPMLAAYLVLEYLAAAFIPDGVTTGGFLFSAGMTIPYGRIIQALAMIGIMLIMMSLGSAQYEVWGTPYDLAWVEKRSIAVENGLAYWEENELQIESDFIGSWDQADSVSVTELIYHRSQAEQRTLVMDDDLALEVGDIVQIPDGRRLFIEKMAKTIKRGEIPKLTLNGFKVMIA